MGMGSSFEGFSWSQYVHGFLLIPTTPTSERVLYCACWSFIPWHNCDTCICLSSTQNTTFSVTETLKDYSGKVLSIMNHWQEPKKCSLATFTVHKFTSFTTALYFPHFQNDPQSIGCSWVLYVLIAYYLMWQDFFIYFLPYGNVLFNFSTKPSRRMCCNIKDIMIRVIWQAWCL